MDRHRAGASGGPKEKGAEMGGWGMGATHDAQKRSGLWGGGMKAGDSLWWLFHSKTPSLEQKQCFLQEYGSKGIELEINISGVFSGDLFFWKEIFWGEYILISFNDLAK